MTRRMEALLQERLEAERKMAHIAAHPWETAMLDLWPMFRQVAVTLDDPTRAALAAAMLQNLADELARFTAAWKARP